MLKTITSGLMALWVSLTSPTSAVNPDNPASVWNIPSLAASAVVDPTTQMTIDQYLQDLATQGYAKTGQGIWIQSSDTLLASNQGEMPLSAASITKIATSLVAVQKWGLEHRFETLIGATGPVQNGVVQGDLVIKGGGDPFFVWEEAIALGNTLNQMGIRQVKGDLVILNNFAMNFETEPVKSGTLLKQAWDAQNWTVEIATQYATLPIGTSRPQLDILGKVRPALAIATNSPMAQAEATRQATPLVRHRSLPLSQLLKLMNIYSNNPMSEMLADNLGGGAVIAQRAATIAGVPPAEIQLVNGSGLGVSNRISARAACAMLIALQRSLLQAFANKPDQMMTVSDLLPVSGRDQDGTLIDRQIPRHAAVKTGTLNEVSALAGVMPSRDRGLIWFAIINSGTDIEGFRAQQDMLLRTLEQQWGVALTTPVTIVPKTTDERHQIGDGSRNEILVQPTP